jgi:uncharacterized membrane protein (UPF0136 family)
MTISGLLKASPNVAFIMGVLCISGGITGYLRTRSIPSIAAGCTVGALYLWSAYHISQGSPMGHQGAFGTSTRFRPVSVAGDQSG